MNGIHDMGGLHGFGNVEVEADEPVFHARWEGRVYAMTQVLDTTGIYNLDEHRHEIELMPAQDYLADGYYGRWLFAMESILGRKGVLARAEVERRIAEHAADAGRTTPAELSGRAWPLPPERKIRWGAWRHEVEVAPRFAVGERVRVRNHQPQGHTRLTAYVRGKTGVVSIVNAQAWVLPDTRAHNAGENLQPVYNVTFAADELWGDAAEPNAVVRVDLSEDYLEALETAR
ncbi:nitrile hydratase [Tistlia consotensis]|uniref:Nitrile hydratase subunit beta n=1 Tax=Tistlia consotensis USBA 355 TaxID=560819 RepID=A0A1Y6C958_9PROT|nr:nitrile hydratase subunit beta [Tistlia consotensis]SMF48989.1 nitrile hydratase [Tistlia consotensis USBA 355]SNR80563.1 nitrile hydratase [Tistlia consotensis]